MWCLYVLLITLWTLASHIGIWGCPQPHAATGFFSAWMLKVKTEGYQEYLDKIKVTENDPAIFLNWNLENVQVFVNQVNGNANAIAQPYFISSPPGRMSQASLIRDIMDILSRVSGGMHGNSLLAPNSMSQALNVINVLISTQENVWFQTHIATFPAGFFLGTVHQILDKKIATAEPVGLAPSVNPRTRQLFQ